ncbi:MAG TPA: hypothetical protein VH684_31465 [Xanthobacteraceae bacterium]|jgi:hypothetical protein
MERRIASTDSDGWSRAAIDSLLTQAKQFANRPECERHVLVTQLISDARRFGLHFDANDIEDEILSTAYGSHGGYWRSKTSQPMPVTRFAHLLATHSADPAERLGEFDRRSQVAKRAESALSLAIDAGDLKSFTRRGAIWIDPRSAAEYLARSPIHRDLLTATFLDFLEPERSRRNAAPPSTSRSLQVSGQELATFVRKYLLEQNNPTQRKIEAAAREAFGVDRVTRQRLRAAFNKARPDLQKPGPRGPRINRN